MTQESSIENQPALRAWNLMLRFGLEVAALVGFGVGAWSQTEGVFRWLLVVVIPFTAAAIWGTFNVLGDPSRSGKAPVVVSGWLRLAIELLVLGGGLFGLISGGLRLAAAGLAVFTVFHYSVSWRRVHWLLASPKPTT